MSAYNRLHFDYSEPPSGPTRKYTVQFKFGDSWLFDYHLGDTLAWGGNDNGQPGKRKVVVHGFAESSSGEEADPQDWFIFIENDIITRAEPDDGRYQFPRTDDYGIVLEE